MAKQAKAVFKTDKLDVVADRGYFKSEEILTCDKAGITVTLPKPHTSNNKLRGRFVKQDFRYLPKAIIAGERCFKPKDNQTCVIVSRKWLLAEKCPLNFPINNQI